MALFHRSAPCIQKSIPNVAQGQITGTTCLHSLAVNLTPVHKPARLTVSSGRVGRKSKKSCL